MLGTTERVSASSTGQQGYFASDDPAISADGRYVAFRSGEDVFVRDRKRDKTRTVSISSTGREGQQGQLGPGDLRRRPLRRLQLPRLEPRPQ